MSVRTRILVAEDDRSVQDLIRTRLDLAGYEAFGARDGRDALRQLKEIRPNALILDINMPELDGFGVLERLRGGLAGPPLPVLVLTARHAAADVRRALDLGAKDFMAKPFNDAQLLARVARLVRSSAGTPPVSAAKPPASAQSDAAQLGSSSKALIL